MSGRELDVLLVGATGFTGGLTARYLAQHAPADVRWAVAGRDEGRLGAVRAELLSSYGVDVPGVLVDLDDPADLARTVSRAEVVATTVGPFARYGDPLVRACAQTGTDYADITGEPAFVDRTWLEHHETAVRTGARLVHACGFDSVPHDLGVLWTVQHLPEGVPLTVRGCVSAGAGVSGGTFASAVEAMGDLRQARSLAARRRRAEPRPADRRVRLVPGRPGRDADLGLWVLPLPTLDPLVVGRSARALERYGLEFSYTHLAGFRSPLVAAGTSVGVATLAGLAQLPPARRALLRARPAGSGPDEQSRSRGWFTVRFVGEGGGRRVVTQVSGGDPGYDETARMLGESALCLALDDLPATSGQVTTAVAMGDALVRRLHSAGIRFELLSDQPVG